MTAFEWASLGNHPLLFGTVSPTKARWSCWKMAGRVTTPYCSGLSLLPSGRFRWVAGWLTCNHPLLFGTVSPTNERGYVSTPGPVSNHPLLFGTVSPTRSSHPRVWVQRKVTTPYCSGLSLLLISRLALGITCLSNHPLLFGTVSPTFSSPAGFVCLASGNHPLLFGTVSPTMSFYFVALAVAR